MHSRSSITPVRLAMSCLILFWVLPIWADETQPARPLTLAEQKLLKHFGPDTPRPLLLWSEKPLRAVENPPEEEVTPEGRIRMVSTPSISVYLPAKEKNSGMAIIMLPGGGYGGLDWVTHVVGSAKCLLPEGIAVIGLKYRTSPPHDVDRDIQQIALLDAQRAVRMVRHHAKTWNIDPQRIGVAGYSAGANLAMLLAGNFEAGDPRANDPIEHESSRPDFVVGCATWHWRELKSPFKFRKDSPPTLLVHATNDGVPNNEDKIGGAPIQMPREIKSQLETLHVPVRMLEFAEGGHGVGNLIPARYKNGFPGAQWPKHLVAWLGALRGTEQAHAEIWRRFVDQHGILLDFTDLNGTVSLPTPEECRAGKPNALGWWSPIENGAMFNGLYMDAALLRWQHTQAEADAVKARRLMQGLLKLNSMSHVPGFVARGVSTDGRSYYPMGSNDQTLPWLVGLWRYWQSNLATAEERAVIKRHIMQTVAAIVDHDWKMPAEAPFGTRGSFQGFHFDEVTRKLFTLKLMHKLTEEDKWQKQYLQELTLQGGESQQTKLQICEAGMKFFYAKTHNWTSCTAVSALRGLWKLETNTELKAAYARGLTASAKLAAESLPLAKQFDPQDNSMFEIDWRKSMLPLWKSQRTEQEAVELAHEQLRAFLKVSPRRQLETAFIREPTSAAWIVTLCPDREIVKQHQPEIEAIIARNDYSRLYYSTFFWVESAWWRLHE
jgi:acetyl esterase/lipase